MVNIVTIFISVIVIVFLFGYIFLTDILFRFGGKKPNVPIIVEDVICDGESATLHITRMGGPKNLDVSTISYPFEDYGRTEGRFGAIPQYPINESVEVVFKGGNYNAGSKFYIYIEGTTCEKQEYLGERGLKCVEGLENIKWNLGEFQC